MLQLQNLNIWKVIKWQYQIYNIVLFLLIIKKKTVRTKAWISFKSQFKSEYTLVGTQQVWMLYLPLLQGDLALLFAAHERPVTPEHSVASVHNVGKGCWEKTRPVLDHPLE